MKTIINFNEIRSLSKKIEKKKPILACVNVNDGRAVWTNSYYMVVINDYPKNLNYTISALDYSLSNDVYPQVDMIILDTFDKREYVEEIVNGEVIYMWNGLNGRISKIDKDIINQVEKLVVDKKFKFNINEVESNKSGATCRIKINPNTTIYFITKATWRENEDE